MIAYDVRIDANRQRIARRLEQVGFRRQKSVFEGTIPHPQLAGLFLELQKWIDPLTDSLTAWPLLGDQNGLKHVGVPRAGTHFPWFVV